MEAAYLQRPHQRFPRGQPRSRPGLRSSQSLHRSGRDREDRLFLRYQTTVQREYDKAISEFRKARAEREKQLLEEAVLQAALERQTPQNKGAAAADGFASQNVDPYAYSALGAAAPASVSAAASIG